MIQHSVIPLVVESGGFKGEYSPAFKDQAKIVYN